MAEEMDLVKEGTVKRYLQDILKIRVSETAVNEFRVRMNDLGKKILTKAVASAKAGKRSTVMPRDLDPAMKGELGEKRPSVEEIMKSIERLSAIELGDLSKGIVRYVESEKARPDIVETR